MSYLWAAAVLAVAEKCVTSRHTGAHRSPGVLAALAELRAGAARGGASRNSE